MEKSSSNHISRRDFIKLLTAAVGAVIVTGIGIPTIGYLISPALRKQDTEAWIPLGLLEKLPIGVPTYFSFTRKEVNG